MTESPLTSLAAPTAETPHLIAAAAPRVVVVGDVMLDGWWLGEVRKISREAPAPVVQLQRRVEAPGGAANTALNAAAMGGDVRLFALVGDDAAGDSLRSLLERGGVDCSGLVTTPDAPTATKSRVVVGDQILARLDEVPPRPDVGALSELAERLALAIEEATAVLICDYDQGGLDGDVRQELLRRLAQEPRPLVVLDAHDPAKWRAVRPDVATPNAEEAMTLLGPDRASDRPALMRARREELLAATAARCVVVTLDRDGTIALPGPDFGMGFRVQPGTNVGLGITEHRTWARPASDRNASGAGDTFVACLTLGLAAGLTAPTALDLAQVAADVVVSQPGTSVCSTADLCRHLGEASVPDLAEVERRVAAYRLAGRRVVLTNGCFDVLHRGHTRLLEQARQLGDVLIVALNDDDSVRRLKGPDRPINPVADRAAVVGALSCVDVVCVFATDTATNLVERLRPDVYVKGGDYSPELIPEAPIVEAYGGQVAILDYVADHSTSAVLRRIRAAEAA